VLDQEQPVCTGGLSLRGSPTQTFTAGATGHLVRVDLALCSPTQHAVLKLTASTTGSSPQSATATLPLPHSWSDCAWYEFDFHHALSVTSGDVLQLTVTSANHASALWGFDGGSAHDAYPGGHGQWMGHPIEDFTFRTYVQ
jgi:hypothetical protein